MQFQPCPCCDRLTAVTRPYCEWCGGVTSIKTCVHCGEKAAVSAPRCAACAADFPSRPSVDIDIPEVLSLAEYRNLIEQVSSSRQTRKEQESQSEPASAKATFATPENGQGYSASAHPKDERMLVVPREENLWRQAKRDHPVAMPPLDIKQDRGHLVSRFGGRIVLLGLLSFAAGGLLYVSLSPWDENFFAGRYFPSPRPGDVQSAQPPALPSPANDGAFGKAEVGVGASPRVHSDSSSGRQDSPTAERSKQFKQKSAVPESSHSQPRAPQSGHDESVGSGLGGPAAEPVLAATPHVGKPSEPASVAATTAHTAQEEPAAPKAVPEAASRGTGPAGDACKKELQALNLCGSAANPL